MEGVGRMRVLVTGSQGYIGAVLMPLFAAAGHDVVGLDSGLFDECGYGASGPDFPVIRKDIRHVEVDDLVGMDAVVHLAGISNDPLGDLDPQCTYDINHLGTVRVAEVAKLAGVTRFAFSSSCSRRWSTLAFVAFPIPSFYQDQRPRSPRLRSACHASNRFWVSAARSPTWMRCWSR